MADSLCSKPFYPPRCFVFQNGRLHPKLTIASEANLIVLRMSSFVARDSGCAAEEDT